MNITTAQQNLLKTLADTNSPESKFGMQGGHKVRTLEALIRKGLVSAVKFVPARNTADRWENTWGRYAPQVSYHSITVLAR